MEGWIEAEDGSYDRTIIPQYILDLGPEKCKAWMDEWHIRPVISGGTSFTGAETLASMTISGTTVGPTSSLLSILTRECVEPIAPAYFRAAGARFNLRANGVISTTATVPTYNLQLVCGPTYANPLTTGQMIAQTGTITPAASTTGNLEWWMDILISVRATGSSGSLLCHGWVKNDFVTAGTYVITPFKNATPPTAVVLTGTGGMLVPLYLDLEIIMGAATAGNTMTCLEYTLLSLN